MLSCCQHFSFKKSTGCIDLRARGHGAVEAKLILGSLGPTTHASLKAFNGEAGVPMQVNSAFVSADQIVSAAGQLRAEIQIFDKLTVLPGVKRPHVHTWISSNMLVELYMLNNVRTFRLTSFSDKRLQDTRDGHFVLNANQESELLEALDELCSMVNKIAESMTDPSADLSDLVASSGKEPPAEGRKDPVTQTPKRRKKVTDSPAPAVPEWPLKVNTANYDGEAPQA